MIPFGYTLHEINTLRFAGRISIVDIVGRQLHCEWRRIENVIEDNKLSLVTPAEEVLKSNAYETITKLKKFNPDFHIQRLEFISHASNSNSKLEPLPDSVTGKNNTFVLPKDSKMSVLTQPKQFSKQSMESKEDQEDYYDNMLCMVSNIENGKRWFGSLFVIKAPYVYHISVNYPVAFEQFATMKTKENWTDAQTKEKMDDFAKQVTSNAAFQERLKKQLVEETNSMEPKDISKLLRNQLLEIYSDSFKKPLIIRSKTDY